MRPRGALLSIFGVAALVYLCGVALDSGELTGEGGIVAFTALAGYVVFATQEAPGRVRWPVAAGLLALAAVVAVAAYRRSEGPGGYGWFADGGAGRQIVANMEGAAAGALADLRWTAFGLLVTVTCLGAGLLRLTVGDRLAGRRRRWLAAGAAGTGVLLLVGPLWTVISFAATGPGRRGVPGPDLVAAVWLPLLAAVAALALAVTAGPRIGFAGTLGVLLLAIPALMAVDDAARRAVPFRPSPPDDGAVFLSDLVATGPSGAGPGASIDTAAMLGAVAMLGGGVLVAAATVRAVRGAARAVSGPSSGGQPSDGPSSDGQPSGEASAD